VSTLADNSFSILTRGLSVLSSDLISIGLSSVVAGVSFNFSSRSLKIIIIINNNL
jgi:hypothetical protein